MLPANAQGVWTILLAIVPGFLATTVWARAKTWRGPSGDLLTVLQSLALSAVIQLVMAPLTVAWLLPIRNNLEEYPERILVWAALAIIVLPIGGGLVTGRLSDRVFNARSAVVTSRLGRWLGSFWVPAPPPSTWDWLFTANPPYGQFLVIEFEDGSRKAGIFAEGSLALTSPEPHGLFLISEWEVDEQGTIVSEVPATAGVTIVETSKIRSIRILESGEEDDEEGESGS